MKEITLKITTPIYLSGVVFLLSLPLLFSLRLMLFGEKAIGNVLYHAEVQGRSGSRYGGTYTHAVISFKTSNNKAYELLGPANVIYPDGKKLDVYYNKKNPNDNLVFNFSSIYISKRVVLPVLLLFI